MEAEHAQKVKVGAEVGRTSHCQRNQEGSKRQGEAKGSYFWHQLVAETAVVVDELLRTSGYSLPKSLQSVMEPEQERAEVCRGSWWDDREGGGWWAGAQTDSRIRKTEKSFGPISLPPSDDGHPGSACSEA